MGKRPAEEIVDGNEAYLKRQKLSNTVKSNTAEDIHSGKQLQRLLAFDQDKGRSRHGIQAFKKFLDGFSAQGVDNINRISVLKEYLDSQKRSDEDDKTAIFLPDLMQTWSLASQSSDDSLLSAVPAVLALLLRTISTILELSEHGLRLGRTLLLKPQQELIARGLTANKSKEFVISPVLRLLREVCIFDGGVLANQVFRARDNTFKGLVRNLSLRYNGDDVEDLRKPSVRTNALRFVLSSLKFLPSDSKRELLNQRDIMLALTKDIRDDPPFMVRDILETLKPAVLLEPLLPRDVKTKIVNSTSLGRIATLYRYNQADVDSMSANSKKPIDEVAHEFLMLACTSPDVGLLNRPCGFYPRGVDPDDTRDVETDGSFIDLGLDSIEWMDKYIEKVPVRNVILSDFIQSLRPWSSIKHSELLLAIFRHAPELIADFFYGKKDFSFDPKLTATWIGYSSFLFSTLQLPIPEFFGHQERYARIPPPPAIVLENILPQPLSQKALTRCLTQPHNNLITFFAIRILCVAFSKLQKALEMYREGENQSSDLWTRAAERLVNGFCQRCPSIKEIILAFRKLTNADLLQREAVTKLLVLYYEVIPRVALDVKFGVSAALVENLQAMENTISPCDRALQAIELENVFKFAQFSPGMRWFSKVETLPISPFLAMLKLAAEEPTGLPLLKLRSVLNSVADENQIFQSVTAISAVDTFIFVLRDLRATGGSLIVDTFVDECISRCASTPIKYIFALEEINPLATSNAKSPISLLLLAIAEQWPFAVKSMDEIALQHVASFVTRYFAASLKIKEDKRVIKALIQKLAEGTPKGFEARTTFKNCRKMADTISVPTARIIRVEPTKESENCASEAVRSTIMTAMDDDNQVEDPNALIKWRAKEVDEVIEGGFAASLIMLLSSEHLSVRKEALTNISKFATKLKGSNLEEKDQIWLLISELVETARGVIDQEALPTIISAFASHAIPVLNDPLHTIYEKINKFLTQGPVWKLDRIPLMYKILDEAPTLDDEHNSETGWLLTYMLSGLRSQADMGIYRKQHVFEKLFSLYNSTYLGSGLRQKILRIIFRATKIEGGSTTLITRFSTMTWLQAQVALGGGMPLKALMEKMLGSCDMNRVGSWAKGTDLDVIKKEALSF